MRQLLILLFEFFVLTLLQGGRFNFIYFKGKKICFPFPHLFIHILFIKLLFQFLILPQFFLKCFLTLKSLRSNILIQHFPIR